MRIKINGTTCLWGYLIHYHEDKALCTLDDGTTILVPADQVRVMSYESMADGGARLVGVDPSIKDLCSYCAVEGCLVCSGISDALEHSNTKCAVFHCPQFKEKSDA